MVVRFAWYVSNYIVVNLQQLEELQDKYDAQVQQSSELSDKLECTRVSKKGILS